MKPLVLKEMAGALVPFVKGDGVARQEAPHECGEAGRTAAKQEMEVIGDERPCDVQECHARILKSCPGGLRVIDIGCYEMGIIA